MADAKPHPGTRLRELIGQGAILVPGTPHPVIARMFVVLGAPAVYVSGSGLANNLAFPDEGLLSRSKVLSAVSDILRVTSVPALVDADTGFCEERGGVGETVRACEALGVAAVQIEDQVPALKRCGHLAGKALISRRTMQKKISRAVAAKTNSDFLVIARCDARSVEGFESAVERARAYVAAGADMIFPEALESLDEFRAFRNALPDTPLLANMTEFGKTPYLMFEEFVEAGYQIVIFPQTVFRAMLQTAFFTYSHLRKFGTQEALVRHDLVMSRKEVDTFLIP